MQLSFRQAVKLVTPPIIPAFVRWCRALPARGKLFDGYDDIFLDLISDAKTYCEYGCGASTIWVATQTSTEITCVDTSDAWLDHVRTQIGRTEGVTAIHVDLGPLGDWGRPLGYEHRDKFIDYVEAPWGDGQSYDLVLIDGRFRMACFLTALMHARPGTKIIFDDYVGRPNFQIAEGFVEAHRRNARQVVFIVPDTLDHDMIKAERDKFLYVME